MRILMVHDEPLAAGFGAERYVERLAAGLRATGDDVEIVAGERRHTGAGKLLDVWDPGARRLLARRAADFRPDVIHHHNIARELSASVLLAASRVPQVMTVHDLRLLGAREHALLSLRAGSERVTTALVRRVAKRRLAATIGVSEPVSSSLRRHGFPAVTTVPVPVAEPATAPRPPEQCHEVVVVARLAPDKGVDVVIDAVRRLARPDVQLAVAGDGPARSALQAAAADLGDRARFVGRLDEVAVSRLLATARVVVVASVPGRRPEGSSMTFVEAAAHGRPVVASDDPALRALAAELGNAVLVPPADPSALAEALRTLLADDALTARLGAAGRAAAGAHAIASVTAATRVVYRAAISAAPR